MSRKSNLVVKSKDQTTEQFLAETANEDTGTGQQPQPEVKVEIDYSDAEANAVVAPTTLNDQSAAQSTAMSADVMTVMNSTTNKSDKIRALLALSLKRGEVAKLLGIRYQHVRNVEITPLKKKT